MKLLTPEQILNMFRDLGLEREEERQRLVLLGQMSPLAAEQERAQVFIRSEANTDSSENQNAELA